MVDHTENSNLQVWGQDLDLQEVCTEFRIQGSPGLDILEKIHIECQNQKGLDLPETYQIDCWSQNDQGVQQWDQYFNSPEISQHIPEIRQHLMLQHHLGKMCLVHQTSFPNFLENSSPRKIKFQSYFVMIIYSKTKFCQNVFPQGNFVLAFHKF